ncbi:Myb_DNA-bind_4 domain-containing protein [Cephalotus follicularis]|uniref:Myb_DNA-bind_4 domain-containing protein n=1 Tax=Cephalotus follicularis TaxID=3775 RepID=A0A1Q3B195_CEPFO|nr:Myb_DNA-bind_4 domain-containing protein [Cephalotus follicularis]
MATTAADPSSPTPQLHDPPTALPISLPPLQPPSSTSTTPISTATTTPSTNPRRLPPPCWSHEETVALIDSYRDKWYSLRRGNLKAVHWQEVADAVGLRCPTASPPKTAVQCRHKMEKLRKRYRTEIQRQRSMPMTRFSSSSWVHFKRMDAMEKGPSVKPDYISDSAGEDNDNDDDEDDDQDYGYHNGSVNTRSVHKLYRNNGIGSSGNGGGGFRIRIPTGVSIAQPGPKMYPKFEQRYAATNPNYVNSNPNPKPSFGSNLGSGSGYGSGVLRGCGEAAGRSGPGSASGTAKREREREREPMGEMVEAIKMLGDGFVRMEQMKMEMAREIETMRMEMEMKRTEMILESQHRIVEAFAKAVSEKKNKKAKRMPSPES